MDKFKIWNKKDSINGIDAEYVINSHNIKDYDEIFLIMNEYDIVTQIEIVNTIKSSFGLDFSLTAEETAIEYLKIKKADEENAQKEQITLEEQAEKIKALELEKERLNIAIKEQDDLLVNATYRIAELEKNGVIKSV